MTERCDIWVQTRTGLVHIDHIASISAHLLILVSSQTWGIFPENAHGRYPSARELAEFMAATRARSRSGVIILADGRLRFEPLSASK